MEKRQIKLNNQIIEYQLNIKKIKRCYLKIVSGKVIVNSSPVFSINDIEKLIYDHKEIILKQINNYFPKYDYVDRGYVYIFNQYYQIVLKDLNEYKAVFHDNKIYVYHHKIQETIEIELKKILYEYIFEQINYYLNNDFNLIVPLIEIKKLKSRWGACFPRQNKVSFNLALVHIEKYLINYVIIHELCHFIQPNHSKLFYQEIEKRMPDYKVKIKKLKEIGI
ncbi:MAG: M48 family metallopeptidase [Thomasclavelia sp.]|uniref:M48 family metallopeptidase n=1 Tax=Thomasclavelia sp. TaxID=3025757 RepID=UPI00399F93F2